MTSLVPRRQAFKKEIQLLSHGFSAPEAWPDGKLTVYPWDTEIDDYLMEQVRSGADRENSLYSMVEKLADLKGANIDQFVVGEVNAVLLIARSIRHDSILEYQSKCPFCNATDNERITVPDELERIGEKPPGYPGYDTLTLPVCQDSVQVRPLLIKDEKIITGRDREARARIPDSVCRLLIGIVTVGGGVPDTLEELHKWYLALHPQDAEYLEAQTDALTPHLNTRIAHQCLKCKSKFFHTLTFDQDFFRSGSAGKP